MEPCKAMDGQHLQNALNLSNCSIGKTQKNAYSTCCLNQQWLDMNFISVHVAFGWAMDLLAVEGYEQLIDEFEKLADIKGELKFIGKLDIVFTNDEGDMMPFFLFIVGMAIPLAVEIVKDTEFAKTTSDEKDDDADIFSEEIEEEKKDVEECVASVKAFKKKKSENKPASCDIKSYKGDRREDEVIWIDGISNQDLYEVLEQLKFPGIKIFMEAAIVKLTEVRQCEKSCVKVEWYYLVTK